MRVPLTRAPRGPASLGQAPLLLHSQGCPTGPACCRESCRAGRLRGVSFILHGLLVRPLKVGRDSVPLFILSAWHPAEPSQIVSWKQRPFLRQLREAGPISYAV